MALGSNHATIHYAANFIPSSGLMRLLLPTRLNLFLGNLVTKMSFKGKKGDTLHIPVPARG